MNILILMIPASILLGVGFLGAFIWALRSDQYEDLDTPAHRILVQDDIKGDGT
jgi:cbb3-type cytochrome oxidase maturation protein